MKYTQCGCDATHAISERRTFHVNLKVNKHIHLMLRNGHHLLDHDQETKIMQYMTQRYAIIKVSQEYPQLKVI